VNAERVAALRAIEGFSDLHQGVLGSIAAAANIELVPAGRTIFLEKRHPDHLHALLTGQVALSTTVGRSTSITEILGPGRLFVLSAVLSDKPYMVSAKALIRCKILRIRASLLRAAMRSEIQLFEGLVGALARHDRMLVRHLSDLKLRTAGQRLGCYLLRLSEEQGRRGEVSLPCPKSTLAAHLGMAPEHLSRAFHTLRSCGVISRGSVFELSDPESLARFSRPDEQVTI
jgi:CRP/FNR family transcriptional activator FtrB